MSYVWRSTLAYKIRGARIIIINTIIVKKNDHLSHFRWHDLNRTICVRMREAIGQSKECYDDFVDSGPQNISFKATGKADCEVGAFLSG